ncbi:MAG: metal ABC transporter permease [Kiritimatiellia bacterium]|nr:metal ABC transporter permease [Lentisphaerota bacterium]
MIELLREEYFRHALLACVFGGAGMALVGVLLVLLQVPFLGICMSHAAFLGAVIGLLLGQPPWLWAMGACAVAGLVVGPVAEKAQTSSNVVLSMVFSATMGLSLILLSRIPGPKTEALNLMWGSLLTVTAGQTRMLVAICLGLCLGVWWFYRAIVAVLFNRELALAGGLPAGLIYYGIIMLGGLTVGAALEIIGGLLIFALLVNPANTARLLSDRLPLVMLLAALSGMTACLAGLMLSYVWDLPVGGSVVLFSTLMYLVVFAAVGRRRPRTGGSGNAT